MVQNVEELRAELNLEPLGERGGLVEREIEDVCTGADDDIAARIAEGPLGRLRKGARIGPTRRIAHDRRRRASGIRNHRARPGWTTHTVWGDAGLAGAPEL